MLCEVYLNKTVKKEKIYRDKRTARETAKKKKILIISFPHPSRLSCISHSEDCLLPSTKEKLSGYRESLWHWP